jgi:hypothetical protein
MRPLLIVCLLPFFAFAQATVEQVQADIDNSLKRGQRHPHIEHSEHFNEQWSRITTHKSVNCKGDLCSEERFGLVNLASGDTLLADFRDIEMFFGRIFLSGDKWACLTDANLKVTHAYDRAQILSRHFIAVADNNRYAVIDTLMRQVLPPKYDSIRQVVDLWAPHEDKSPDFMVEQQGKWGVVNYKDGVKINLVYDMLIDLDGFAGFAAKKGKYGFVRWDGSPVSAFTYDSMYTDWSSPNFIVTKDKMIGLMDDNGKELLKPSLSEVTRTSTYGCRCVKRGGKYAVISSRGINLSGFIYDEFKPYQTVHDEMLFSKNGKWGFFGCRSKKEISPFIYDNVVAFYGYEADVTLNGVKKKIKLKDE